MHKGISISRFALGSLRHRWRRQISLVIGIVLAVFFVSAVFLLSQSIYYSYQERYYRTWGKQDLILRDAEGYTDPQQLRDIGLAKAVGEARVFGESEVGGLAFGFYDEAGQALRYPNLLSGRMPEKPGEVAIEAGALEKLRLNISLGDSFDITLRTPLQGKQFLDKTDTRHFTLVGILRDQRLLPPNMVEYNAIYAQLPQALTVAGEQAAPGGREIVHYLIDAPLLMGEEKADAMLRDAGVHRSVLAYGFKLLDFDQGNFSAFLLILALSLGSALILTACMAIVNALNTSLSERSRQIGMLRAVGATSGQIRRIYGREAVLTALITAPLAILLAWGTVALLVRLVGEPLRLYMVWWFLPVTLLLSVAVVLMAAALPLRRAARVSPMQALRDTSLLRARRRLRISPKADYKPARLMALRHLQLYRSRQSGIALIVVAAMLTISLAYVGITLSGQQINTPFDYTLSQQSFSIYHQVDYSHMERLLSENDVAEVAQLPGMSTIQAAKRLEVNMNLPKLTDYLLESQYWNVSMYQDATDVPGEELSLWREIEREWYKTLLKSQNIQGELFSVTMAALDDASIEALEDCVVAGKIDLAALHSGTQVLVTAPDQLYVVHNERNPQGMKDVVTRLSQGDQVLGTIRNDMFAAHDTLDLVHLKGTDPEKKGIMLKDEDFSTGIVRTDRQVTIGALLDMSRLKLPAFAGYHELSTVGSILTSLPGLRSLGLDEVGYNELAVTLAGEPSEAARDRQHEGLAAIAQRADNMQLWDGYRSAQENRRWMSVLWAAVISLILLFFVLALSMVNNAVTNRLKSDRNTIGTLRAVGADLGTIFRSYRAQVSYLLLGGGAVGLILGPLVTLYLVFWRNGPPPQAERFSLPVMLGMLVAFLLLLILLSSVNLHLRLRQITRSSIVENIRQL